MKRLGHVRKGEEGEIRGGGLGRVGLGRGVADQGDGEVTRSYSGEDVVSQRSRGQEVKAENRGTPTIGRNTKTRFLRKTLLLVAVAAVVSGQFPKPDSAPAGFGGGASQVPFPPKRKPGAPPPFTAPAGSGAGASQVPFPPKGQPGVPPPFTAPAGFGPAESQRPFLDPPRRPPAPPPVPSGDVIPILVDERDGPHPDGSYSFNFETGNGISRYEQGAPQGETGAVASQGGWSCDVILKNLILMFASSIRVIFQCSRHYPAITSSSSNHVIFQQSRHLPAIMSSSSNHVIFQ
ncbi:putative endocuticle structural glycoprotein SgAbd-8-like [Homarus americanus]|uniref:Putative endocuticle structural glycoprotein SgAbd-8-like n=1 Tax=Homarus americanus TaxID=6706 RepID=A0A8J5JC95_HOMAM|nr:putative endocuticle structural glycoprotein SgAbd-8-like [Homarus americanus]